MVAISIPPSIDLKNISFTIQNVSRCYTPIPDIELHALKDLYSSTNGSSWLYRDHMHHVHWNFSGSYVNPCNESWAGVYCATLLPNTTFSITIPSYPSSKRGEDWPLNQSQSQYYSVEEEEEGNSTPHKDYQAVQSLEEGSVCHVIGLGLPKMNLRGSVPSSISALKHLKALVLNFNYLTGTIPESLYELSELFLLNFYDNRLTGSLSTAMANLTGLEYLGLETNIFSGTIPTELGLLTRLTQIYLYQNHLTGTLPTELGRLTNLAVFVVYDNSLDGTLPLQLHSLHKLFNFEMHKNLLTGPFPTIYGDTLVNLKYLYVNTNYLSFTLPSTLGNVTTLEDLYAYGNFFSGLIPCSLGKLSRLSYMGLYDNLLSGSLPVSFAQLTAIEVLLVHNNILTGSPLLTFPLGISLPYLRVVDLSENAFTGSLPLSLIVQPKVNSVAMIKNCFSGSISPSICSASSTVEVLAMDGLTSGFACRKPILPLFRTYTSSLIHGTIPPCLFQLPSIVNLQLSGNGLSGPLPSDFDGDGSDGYLIANDNSSQSAARMRESRRRRRLLSPSLSPTLQYLVISHNRISGTLPVVFQSHRFAQFDASYNRLSGTCDNMGDYFSSIVCNNATIGSADALAIIGDFNETSCSVPSLTLEVNRLSGYLPSSFIDAEYINILSGNLFGCLLSGLPRNDPAVSTTECGSSVLYFVIGLFLCLCIPPAFFYFRYCYYSSAFSNLKQSQNLGSILLTSRISTASLSDDSSTLASDNISIEELQRVMARLSHIQAQEEEEGRVELSIEREGWGCWAIVKWRVLKFHRFVVRCSEYVVLTWISHALAHAMYPQGTFFEYDLMVIHFVELVRVMVLRVALGLSVVFIPLYAILKLISDREYSTHTYEYGWYTSAAYLTGYVPAVVMFAVFSTTLIVIVGIFVSTLDVLKHKVEVHTAMMSSSRFQSSSSSSSSSSTASSAHSTASSTSSSSTRFMSIKPVHVTWTQWIRCVLAFVLIPVLDIVVMVLANGLFLYVLFRSSAVVAVVVQSVLVLFKLGWNRLVVPPLISRFVHSVDEVWGTSSTGVFAARGLGLQTALTIFNNLFAPCIAIFATDPTCFYNVIIPNTPVFTDYTYFQCVFIDGITGNCVLDQATTTTSSFVPPFLYSFQCSSALLVTYVPVFMLMYCFTGCVVPILDVLLIWLCKRSESLSLELARGDEAALRNSTIWGMICRFWCLVCLPKIPLLFQPVSAALRRDTRATTTDRRKAGMSRVKRPVLFNASNLAANSTCNLVIMLTYGVAYPPLSLVIAIAVVVDTFHVQHLVGRYLLLISSLPDESSRPAMFEMIERSVKGVWKVLDHSLIVIFLCFGLFFAFFLSDIVGDQVESSGRTVYWVPLASLVLPPLCVIGFYALHPTLKALRAGPIDKSSFHSSGNPMMDEWNSNEIESHASTFELANQNTQ